MFALASEPTYLHVLLIASTVRQSHATGNSPVAIKS